MLGIFRHIPWFRRSAALPRATVAMEQRMKGNPLWGANPDRLVAAVAGWDAGNIAELARLVDAYEIHDDTAKIGVKKRDASVARCEHTILIEEGSEKDPRAQLHRDTLTKFWASVRVTSAFNRAQRGGIRLLKKQMMSAQSIGWSCHNIVWDTSNQRAITAKFIHIPMWHFENLTGELRFKQLATDYYGVPMADGEWLVHTGDAIGPAVALACCAKRLSLQDWMLFSERAAIPGLLAKTDAAYGTDAWNRLVEMLRAWGRDWRGITDRNTDITSVTLNGSGEPPMPRLVERMDRAIAALYRGADLSTISKGEGLGASLQGEESDMLEIDDCAALSESLHEQVDRYVIRYMTGDDTPLAYIWIEPVSKPNIDGEIKKDAHLMSCGIKLSKRDMLQRYGRTEADPDDPEDAAVLRSNVEGLNVEKLNGSAPFNLSTSQLFNSKAAGLLQTALPSFKTPSKKPDAQGEVSGADASEGVLEAFSKDTSKAAAEIRKLLALVDAGKTQEAASFAASLAANIQSLMPEDPEMATVIMDAMATSFADAWEDTAALANENPYHCPKCGKFSGFNGHCEKCGYTLDANETQKRAERLMGKAMSGTMVKPIDGLAFRDEIGQIDLEVGKLGTGSGMEHGTGLAKIKQKHGRDIHALAETLAHGEIMPTTKGTKVGNPYDPDRKAIVHGTYVIFLQRKGNRRWKVSTHYKSANDATKSEEIKQWLRSGDRSHLQGGAE